VTASVYNFAMRGNTQYITTSCPAARRNVAAVSGNKWKTRRIFRRKLHFQHQNEQTSRLTETPRILTGRRRCQFVTALTYIKLRWLIFFSTGTTRSWVRIEITYANAQLLVGTPALFLYGQQYTYTAT